MDSPALLMPSRVVGDAAPWTVSLASLAFILVVAPRFVATSHEGENEELGAAEVPAAE